MPSNKETKNQYGCCIFVKTWKHDGELLAGTGVTKKSSLFSEDPLTKTVHRLLFIIGENAQPIAVIMRKIIFY